MGTALDRLLLWLLERLVGREDALTLLSEHDELDEVRARSAETGARGHQRGTLAKVVAGAAWHRLTDTVRRIGSPGSEKGEVVGELWADARYGLRRVARAPVFAASVILTVRWESEERRRSTASCTGC